MSKGNHVTKDEFKQRLEELRTIISNGIACFWTWRGLLVEDEGLAKGLDRYRAFFRPARWCLQQMTLLQFAKVFDPDYRTVSLRNLLAEARRDRQNREHYAFLTDLTLPLGGMALGSL